MPIFSWFWSMCRFLTDTRQMGLNMTKTSNFYSLACLREMPPRMLPGEQVVSYCKFYSWLETRWEDKKDGEGVVIKMHQNNFVRNLAIFRPHFLVCPYADFFKGRGNWGLAAGRPPIPYADALTETLLVKLVVLTKDYTGNLIYS